MQSDLATNMDNAASILSNVGFSQTANDVAAIANLLRTGKLIVVDDGAVERMARALAAADGIEICSDAIYALSSYGHRATAALGALTKGADHAG